MEKRRIRVILGINIPREVYTKEHHNIWRSSIRSVILGGNKKMAAPKVFKKETSALCSCYYYFKYYYNRDGIIDETYYSPGFLIEFIFIL